MVNGKSFKAYVDTGCYRVTIKFSEVNKLQISYNEKEKPSLKGFGNKIIACLGACKFTLNIDDVETVVSANVVLNKIQEIPLLVGCILTELSGVLIKID